MSTHCRECMAEDPATIIRGHGQDLPSTLPSDVRGVAFGDLRPARIAAELESVGRSSVQPRDSMRIPAADGRTLAADVSWNGVDDERGVIVFVHGFCGDRSENGLFEELGRTAAAAGFSTVSYDWRGLGDSDGDFLSTTFDEHVEDFQSVADWVRNRAGREAPLYAVGFSLGAAVIGLSLKRRPMAEAVAYLSPAVRPRRSMWPRYDTDEIRSEMLAHGFIRKPGGSQLVGRAMLEALRDTDLGLDAFRLDVPLLVCHGTDDARVDCAHTRELVAARGLERNFGYLEIEGASHSFRPSRSHWQVLAAALISWFRDTRPLDADTMASRRPAKR